MFICIPKITSITFFFLEILHFKETCNLIVQPHFDLWFEKHNFASYGNSVEISITILLFTLYHFKEKLMIQFLKKLKNLIWGHFKHFLPKFWQKWVFWEKWALSVFKYYDYLPSCKKKRKKVFFSHEDRARTNIWCGMKILRRLATKKRNSWFFRKTKLDLITGGKRKLLCNKMQTC